jgi:hypothetical protein
MNDLHVSEHDSSTRAKPERDATSGEVVNEKQTTDGSGKAVVKRRGKPRGGHDPSIAKAYWYKPGQSGNPGGRRKNLISDATKEWLKEVDPKTGKTNAQLVSEAQGKKAKKGDTGAYSALRDTSEGKPAQTQQHQIVSGPVKVQLEPSDLVAKLRAIYGLSNNGPAAPQLLSEGVDRGPKPPVDSDQGS